MRVILTGGAGLVGQNLVVLLKEIGLTDIIVLDKHRANLAVLAGLHPEIQAYCVDLAEQNGWDSFFESADVVVMLQAQIGGDDYSEFIRNNVDSTRLVLAAIKRYRTPYMVHISSSVVESVVDDFYTQTKITQEKLVLDSGITCSVLRPTLMFGWFDRKHLGWLARFMKKVPIFPIPGHGRYMRQPLYVRDFCNVIISCIKNRVSGGIYNITGHERVDYIDLIREIKSAIRIKTPVVRIPYHLFYVLIWIWGVFDKNPPFTTQQLKALIAKDEFEVIDWPHVFNVPCTSFKTAIDETFNDPRYSSVVLEF